MNFKDKLIKQLVEVGKRHRILVYPTLALVAVISAISNAVYWGRSNSKRAVASVLVVVLLITQSMFLTSSAATEGGAGDVEVASGTDASTESGDGENGNQNDGETDDNGLKIQSADTLYSSGDGNGNVDEETGDGENAAGGTTEETVSADMAVEVETPFTVTESAVIAYGTKSTSDSVTVQKTYTRVYEKSAEGVETISYYNQSGTEVSASDIFTVDEDELNETLFGANVVTADKKDYVSYSALYTSNTYRTEVSADTLNQKLKESYTITDKTPVENGIYTIVNDTVDIGIWYTKATVSKIDVTYSGSVYADDKTTVLATMTGGDTLDLTGTNGRNVSIVYSDDTKDKFSNTTTGDSEKYKNMATLSGILVNVNGNLNLNTLNDKNTTCTYTVAEADVKKLSVTIQTSWTTKNVKVTFDSVTDNAGLDGFVTEVVDGGKDDTTASYSYAGSITMPDPVDKGWATPNEGYEFVGWRYNDTTYEKGQTVSVYDIIPSNTTDTVTLEGVWQYKQYKLIDSDGNSIDSISASYATKVNKTVTVTYKDDTTGGFGISISDDDKTWLESYGITATGTNELGGYAGYYEKYTFSGTVTDVTTAPKTITLNIIDTKKAGSDKTLTPSSVSMTFSPLDVAIDPTSIVDVDNSESGPTKVYDGKTDIISRLSGTAGIAAVSDANVDKTVIAGDAMSVTYTGAKLTDANAATGKDIVLSGVQLDALNTNISKYNLTGIYTDDEGTICSTVSGRGVVTRKEVSLSVKVKGSDSDTVTVKFGEGNPTFELAIDDDNLALLTTADSASYDSSADADNTSFFKNVFGFTGFSNTRTSVYLSGDSYDFVAGFTSTGKNYTVTNAKSLIGHLTVLRDDIEGKYVISPESPGEDGYYGADIQIKPIDGGYYDSIRLCSGDNDDISSGTTNVKNKFSESIYYDNSKLLKDMTSGTVYIQLYNSSTGAVSKVEAIEDLSIDATGPVLSSCTVTPAALNVFNFGAYYKPDESTEVVKFTFVYTSSDSKCDKMYYYFEDETLKNATTPEELSLVEASDGTYTASMTVSTKDYGQIRVYAVDKSGNRSEKYRIRITNTSVLTDKESTVKDYFEWMVENVSVEAALSVTDSAGAPAATDSAYYSKLTATVTAKDVSGTDSQGISGINRVKWNITDGTNVLDSTETKVSSLSTKVTEQTFSKALPTTSYSGEVYIGATVYDNAGNATEIDPVGPYLMDSVAPVLEDQSEGIAKGTYVTSTELKFIAYEKDSDSTLVSGIKSVELFKKDATGKNWESVYVWNDLNATEQKGIVCTYELDADGTYKAKAVDNAGNESAEITWIISGISNVKPDAPTITLSPELDSEDGWYTGSAPDVNIAVNNSTSGSGKNLKPVTSDKVPINTVYTVKLNGVETDLSGEFEATATAYSIKPEYEGVIEVTAVNVSASGVKSNPVTVSYKVDTVKPVINITNSTVDDEGKLIIDFEITDDTSGVDWGAASGDVWTGVTVNGEPEVVGKPDANGVVSGTFSAEQGVVYTISARDIAGNEAEPAVFNPLDIQTNPVTEITENTAYLEADIIEGTCEIEECYIELKKTGEADKKYVRLTTVNKLATDSGIKLKCNFRNLVAGTSYDYRIYAKTKTSNEEKEFEGSFVTLSQESQGYISGTVRYDDGVNEEYRTYPIYVTLESGNTVYGGVSIDKDSDDGFYEFKNIPDGEYQVNVVCGNYSKTASVIISEGGIAYPSPEDYGDGINFVINGLSTSVEIDSDTQINADGLDALFETEFYANVSADDYKALDDGGNILVTLHANTIDNVQDVETDVLDLISEKIGEENRVKTYFDIYMTKTVTDGSGNGEPVYITNMLPDKTLVLTFTDESLAGKPMYVVGVSRDLVNNRFVIDTWGPSLTGRLTIKTDHCSTYAIYTAKPEEYTVTWVDGDGQTVGTDTVEEGSTVTAPDIIPTKLDTKNYKYEFTGWNWNFEDTITADTTIYADFKRVKKTTSNDSTTEDTNTGDNPTTEDTNTGDNLTTEDTNTGDNLTTEDTNTGDTSTTEDTNTGDASTTEDTNTGDASTTEDTNTGDASTTEDTNAGDVSTTEDTNTGDNSTTESPKPGNSTTTESPKPGSSTTTESPKPGSSTTTESPKPGDSTTTESTKPDNSTTTESPKPGDSTTTESPKPGNSTTTESPKPGNSTTTESPKPGDSTTTESPKPGNSTTTESPKPDNSTTTESPKPDDGTTTEGPVQDNSTTDNTYPDNVIIQMPSGDSDVIVVQVPDSTQTVTTVVSPSNTGTGSGAGDDTGIDITTNNTHYTYLGSSSSPKTGDTAPIVVVGILLLISAMGLVVVIRKNKQQF